MLIGPVLDDMDRAEKFLETETEAASVKYTVVLPAGLKNYAVTGKASFC